MENRIPTRLTDAEVEKVRTYWRGRGAEFLGSPDAERDIERPQWFESLFVKSPASNKIISGGARIVIGRKGSGKSAARFAASESLRRAQQQDMALSISADDAFATHADEFTKLSTAGVGLVSAWYKTFAFEILRAVAQELAGRPLTSEAEVLLRNWALKEALVERDFGERVISGARHLFPRLKKFLDGMRDEAALSKAHVEKLLAEAQVVLYIDDFDNLYRPGQTTFAVNALRGALEAADRLTIRNRAPAVTILMREDLWLLCRSGWHYLDKVTGEVNLQWTEAMLREWLGRRMKSAVAQALNVPVGQIPADFDSLWPIFFLGDVRLENDTHSKGFGYVLRRTLYTPRDLLKFLARMIEVSKKLPVTQKDLVEAEGDYSRDRMQYLVNEFEVLCNGLKICMQSFSGRRMEMQATDLYKHLRGLLGSGQVKLTDAINDADEEVALARFLFRIGFLEIRIQEADRFERRDALNYPDYWQGIRRDDSVKWAIRSTFYRQLRSHRRQDAWDRIEQLLDAPAAEH